MKEFYDFFQNEELYPDLDVEGAVQRLSRAVQFKTV